ncbi:MAG: ribonuclease P protein component [Planctomycetota bacterium]
MIDKSVSEPDQRFRRHERIRRKVEYDRVFARKKSRSNELFIVYVAPNEWSWPRLGVIVGKRVGNAVRRNRARRRIREAFRLIKHELPKSVDVVCIASARCAQGHGSLAEKLKELVMSAMRR